MHKIIDMNGKQIGGDSPCYMIAEMSANHAGSIDRAIEIIHAAKDAGADCIKIQTYTPDTITIDVDNEFFRIKDGKWKGENLYNLYKKAFTPWEWQGRLKEEAMTAGIDFLSTPFDKSAVDFLEQIGVGSYKIASFEVVDIPLIKYIASKRKPIIMSTGMATLGEVEEAVNAVRSQGNNDLCLLKCSSAYPAIPKHMNLKTIKHMEETFQVPAGLSDHSLGSVAAVTAVAMGAKVIEKHFCISREIENPDASFSMEPSEFKKMVEDVREAEKAMGRICYDISKEEKASRSLRKSIFVVKDIKQGETLSEENIRVIRPGYGLPPKYYEDLMGKKARKDVGKGTPLDWSVIES